MLLERIRRWFQFRLEQFLLGGAHYRLFVIIAAIGAISVASGALVMAFESRHFQVDNFGEAVWWAFLRLTDPGYLGDDHGGIRRTVSTALTVTGYVLFMGALVATMTQGLNERIQRLERGFTPVALKNHIVVIGWTASTPELLLELTASWERVRHFLRRLNVRGLRIAILAEDVGPEMEQALKDRLGDRYSRSKVILRSGSPLQWSHMERVDYRRAAVIVFSPPDSVQEPGEASEDAQLTKAIVTLGLQLKGKEHIPVVVAAVSDPLKLPILKATYPAARAELFAATSIVSRMLARFARHEGLSHVVDEMLSQQYGSELYLFRLPEFDGVPFSRVAWAYENAIVLGFTEPTPAGVRVVFGFALEEPVPEGATLIFLATEATLEDPAGAAPEIETTGAPLALDHGDPRELLIVGWSPRVPWLLDEFASDRQQNWSICIASLTAQADRERHVQQAGVHVRPSALRHVQCDCTVLSELRALDVGSFDTVIVLASDSLESAEDADARTLLIHQMLRSLGRDPGARRSTSRHARVLVELKDPSNADLFELTETEVIPSSVLVSHVLAQVALRPELQEVLDALLTRGGAEIALLPPALLKAEGTITFRELMARGAQRRAIVLGVRAHSRATQYGGVVLNPPRADVYHLGPHDRVIVLLSDDRETRPGRAL